MGRGLGWVTHRGPFQPRSFCDSMTLSQPAGAGAGEVSRASALTPRALLVSHPWGPSFPHRGGGCTLPASGLGALPCPDCPGWGFSALKTGICETHVGAEWVSHPELEFCRACCDISRVGRWKLRTPGDKAQAFSWESLALGICMLGEGLHEGRIVENQTCCPKQRNHGRFFFSFSFFKLLNSALLQFINQSVNQTAGEWRYFRS